MRPRVVASLSGLHCFGRTPVFADGPFENGPFGEVEGALGEGGEGGAAVELEEGGEDFYAGSVEGS